MSTREVAACLREAGQRVSNCKMSLGVWMMGSRGSQMARGGWNMGLGTLEKGRGWKWVGFKKLEISPGMLQNRFRRLEMWFQRLEHRPRRLEMGPACWKPVCFISYLGVLGRTPAFS